MAVASLHVRPFGGAAGGKGCGKDDCGAEVERELWRLDEGVSIEAGEPWRSDGGECVEEGPPEGLSHKVDVSC
jgi:hypothetical protein